MNDDAVCKGCWQLANNCGRCPRCLETAHEAVALIRRFLDENGRLRGGERRPPGPGRGVEGGGPVRKEGPEVSPMTANDPAIVSLCRAVAGGDVHSLGPLLDRLEELGARRHYDLYREAGALVYQARTRAPQFAWKRQNPWDDFLCSFYSLFWVEMYQSAANGLCAVALVMRDPPGPDHEADYRDMMADARAAVGRAPG
jgi:hypothetical protein